MLSSVRVSMVMVSLPSYRAVTKRHPTAGRSLPEEPAQLPTSASPKARPSISRSWPPRCLFGYLRECGVYSPTLGGRHLSRQGSSTSCTTCRFKFKSTSKAEEVAWVTEHLSPQHTESLGFHSQCLPTPGPGTQAVQR